MAEMAALMASRQMAAPFRRRMATNGMACFWRRALRLCYRGPRRAIDVGVVMVNIGVAACA